MISYEPFTSGENLNRYQERERDTERKKKKNNRECRFLFRDVEIP